MPPDRPTGSAEETGGADERRGMFERVLFSEPWGERVPGAGLLCRDLKIQQFTEAQAVTDQTIPFTACSQASLNLRLIQILLKPREDLANFFGLSQVGHSIGDGIVIFELQ